MNFFFDQCISPKLARAMHALVEPAHRITHLREKWPDAERRTVDDVTWLEFLGREGNWVVISGDLRIRNRPKEREIWKAAKLTTFFMAHGFPALPGWEQVRWLVDKWPLIEEMAHKVSPGSAFIVPKKGNKLQTV